MPAVPMFKLKERSVSLSSLLVRRQRTGPVASSSAPLLPTFDFESLAIRPDVDIDDQEKGPGHGDMNDKYRKIDDAVQPSRPQSTLYHQQSHHSMPAFTSPRNGARPLAVDTVNVTSEANAHYNGHSNGTAQGNGVVSPWQRSNPHTAPANTKTSQYIDKLTQENERLRRELRAEKLAREDETKRAAAAHARVQDMQAESQHLQYMADTSARTIERRDRKIEELKSAIEIEKNRRLVTDNKANEALGMLGNIRSETQKELAMAHEMRIRAETNAEAARDSYKRMIDRLDKQLTNTRDQVRELRRQREDADDKLQRLNIIHDQLQSEANRRLHTETRMRDMMDKYKKEKEKEIEDLVEEARRLRIAIPIKEKELADIIEETRATRDKMKWVMAQHERKQRN